FCHPRLLVMNQIKKSLANTSFEEREDLEQEIKLKIVEKLYTVEFSDTPVFGT
ncbi:hypothetical protein N784_13580, partial [Pontibacillus litoralis JSM 072002]